MYTYDHYKTQSAERMREAEQARLAKAMQQTQPTPYQSAMLELARRLVSFGQALEAQYQHEPARQENGVMPSLNSERTAF